MLRKSPSRIKPAPLKPAPSRQVRGNSYDRRRRRAWIIATFGVLGKNGKRNWVLCHHCGKRCKAKAQTWEVDRWPLCGHAGGRYTRDNIRPACQKCNRGRCSSCPNRR